MNYRSILIVCLATLGLAVASWGQADGKISFISDRDGHDDVWIMNADGSDPVNLTQGRDCISPAWSPDGTKIAYIGDVFDDDQYGGEIWLMDADGGNPQQLTDDRVILWLASADKESLSWSEDGSSIYYTTMRSEDGGFSIEFDNFVVGLDGSEPIYVDSEFPGPGTLSPDGTKRVDVVISDEDGQARLYIYDLVEYEKIAIDLTDLPNFEDPPGPGTQIGASATWSPDGMRVAFEFFPDFFSQREIWAVDIDGSNLVELTNGLGGHSPAWQPAIPAATNPSRGDGSNLCFQPHDIYLTFSLILLKGATL